MLEKIALLTHVSATFWMTGVIWMVQLVQYPFFAYVAEDKFIAYHDAYRFWITPIVGPAMIVELLTGVLLVAATPAETDARLVWLGLLLIAVVWASTFFLQVPLHEKLAAGFDARAHAALVATNWLRTIAWTMRGGLALYFLAKTIR